MISNFILVDRIAMWRRGAVCRPMRYEDREIGTGLVYTERMIYVYIRHPSSLVYIRPHSNSVAHFLLVFSLVSASVSQLYFSSPVKN